MLLAMLGIASFFVCTQLMTNAILQASGYEKLALLTLPFGGAIKILVNWILVGTPGININGAPVVHSRLLSFYDGYEYIVHYLEIKGQSEFSEDNRTPRYLYGSNGRRCRKYLRLIFKVCPQSFTSSRLGLLAALVASIFAAVVIYGILIVALRAVTREDMKLIPKGERLADLLHIR